MRCKAQQWLTQEDWMVVDFYRRVADQYINTDMTIGQGKGAIPVLVPRLEAYEAALRVGGYPRELWSWLMDNAATFHRLVRKIEQVNWFEETGKTLGMVRPEDLLDGS